MLPRRVVGRISYFRSEKKMENPYLSQWRAAMGLPLLSDVEAARQQRMLELKPPSVRIQDRPLAALKDFQVPVSPVPLSPPIQMQQAPAPADNSSAWGDAVSNLTRMGITRGIAALRKPKLAPSFQHVVDTVGAPTFFANGGAPPIRRNFVVGEEAPKIMLDAKSGKVRVVGLSGPEVLKTDTQKIIVPIRSLTPAAQPDTNQQTSMPPVVRPIASPSPDAIQQFNSQNEPPLVRLVSSPGAMQQDSTPTLQRPIVPIKSPQDTSAMTAPASQMMSRPVAFPPPVAQPVQDASTLARSAPAAVVPLAAMPPSIQRIPQETSSVTTPDASTMSVDERRRLMFDGGMPDPAAITRTPAVQPIAAPQSTDMLGDINRRIHEREARPARDHNGRLKSSLITAGRMALEGLAHGGIGGGIGAGIAGLVTGAVAPATDERLSRRGDVAKLNQEFGVEAARQKEMVGIQNTHAEAAVRLASVNGQNSEAKKRSDLVKELKARMGLTGNKLNPRADPRQAELAAQLNMSASSGGARFNPQGLRTIRGADGQDRLVYASMEGGELGARYIDVEGNAGASLSEKDRRQLALEVERENRQRGEDGMKPIGFPEDTPPVVNAPSTPLVLAPAGGQPTVKRIAPPVQPVAAPARPSGMVQTGAPPEPVTRQGYGGRGHYGGGYRRGGGGGYRASGGGDTSKGDSIAYGQLSGIMRDVEGMKDNAAHEAAKGNQAGAQDILSRANALVENTRANPNFRDKIEAGVSEGWPYIKLHSAPAVQSAPASSQQSSQPARGGGQYAGMKFHLRDLAKMSRDGGMSERATRAHILSEGGTWIR
jgi:hypothetical protein